MTSQLEVLRRHMGQVDNMLDSTEVDERAQSWASRQSAPQG